MPLKRAIPWAFRYAQVLSPSKGRGLLRTITLALLGTFEQLEKPEKPEKPEKLEQPEKPEKLEKPEQLEQLE